MTNHARTTLALLPLLLGACSVGSIQVNNGAPTVPSAMPSSNASTPATTAMPPGAQTPPAVTPAAATATPPAPGQPAATATPRPPTATATPAAPPPAAARTAGVASGTAVDGRGNPLKDVQVDIVGTVAADGRYLAYFPATDAAGKYRQEDIAPGTYTAKAWHEVDYNGKTYRLPLASPQGVHSERLSSEEGILRDFVWKISGAKPGGTATSGNGKFYGGSVKVYGADYYGTPIEAAEGSTIVVTLEPDGPLIDGTTGETVTIEVPFKKSGSALTSFDDVPIGRYTLSAVLRGADGSTKALRVLAQNGPAGTADSHYTATAPFDFEPNGSANIRPYQEVALMQQAVYVRL